MYRLTEWTENGACLILDNPESEEQAKMQLMEKFKRAVGRLACYEDLGTIAELSLLKESIEFYKKKAG